MQHSGDSHREAPCSVPHCRPACRGCWRIIIWESRGTQQYQYWEGSSECVGWCSLCAGIAVDPSFKPQVRVVKCQIMRSTFPPIKGDLLECCSEPGVHGRLRPSLSNTAPSIRTVQKLPSLSVSLAVIGEFREPQCGESALVSVACYNNRVRV